MATDSVLGLFQDPALLQQQQYNTALDRGVQLAQLDPFQRASAMMYTGGNVLGGAIGSALGAEDPTLKLMSTRQTILKDYDPNTLEGLQGAAKALRDAGDLQGSYALAQKAQEAALKESQVTKNMREGRAAGTQIKEVGVAEGTREPVYTYQTPSGVYQVVFKTGPDGQQRMVPYNGGVDRATSKTSVSVDSKGESAFSIETGKLDAKAVADAAKTREAAIGELGNLQKMAELNNQAMVTGTFASGRTAVGNLFGTLGIASSKDKFAVANSEQYEKYAGNLLLDKIKKLGTNPSNSDREFIARIIPQLENSAKARQELITYMAGKAQEVIEETTRLDQYARKNKGLGGYTPKIPMVSAGTPSPYSDMSDAELNARIARAQAAQRKQ